MCEINMRSVLRSPPSRSHILLALVSLIFSMAASGWLLYDWLQMRPYVGSHDDISMIEVGAVVTVMAAIYLYGIAHMSVMLLKKPDAAGTRAVATDHEKGAKPLPPEPLYVGLRNLGWTAVLPTKWARLDDRGLKTFKRTCILAAFAPPTLYFLVIGATLQWHGSDATALPRWFDALFSKPVRTIATFWHFVPLVVWAVPAAILAERERRRAGRKPCL